MRAPLITKWPGVAIATLLLVIGCGGEGKKDPATSADPNNASTTAPSAPEATPASTAAAAPVKKRKPYEIVNLCPRTATIIFGEDPKAANAGKRTLAGNDKIDDGPRDPDGNQVIHLLVRDEPLVKVHVSRATKRVEIGTSCDTLEMH
jgi:hypothetical protein